MEFSRYDTAYWTQKQPSNVRFWDCRDSEKMLCKKFPLKHEVRGRGRDEMLCENAFKPNITVVRHEITNTNDICDI